MDEYAKMCQSLLAEALSDEEAYVWYAERDCELKGYQWKLVADRKYALLVSYALSALFGLPFDGAMRAINDACLAAEDEGI